MNKSKGFKRVGEFVYKQLNKDTYEIGLDIPVKLYKKDIRKIEEYLELVLGNETKEYDVFPSDQYFSQFRSNGDTIAVVKWKKDGEPERKIEIEKIKQSGGRKLHLHKKKIVKPNEHLEIKER